MKIIVAGATGFIGRAVLKRALAHPKTTKVIALARRELPTSTIDVADSSIRGIDKLQVVVHKDFGAWTQADLELLKGSAACVWTIGNTPATVGKDLAAARLTSLDNTLAAARSFATHLATHMPETGSRFRFVYVSGAAVVRDQNAKLWFMGEFRKMRGEVETQLFALQKEQGKTFDLVIARPGGVLDQTLFGLVDITPMVVNVHGLAAALVEIGVEGSGIDGTGEEDESRRSLENAELVRRGIQAQKSFVN